MKQVPLIPTRYALFRRTDTKGTQGTKKGSEPVEEPTMAARRRATECVVCYAVLTMLKSRGRKNL